MPLPFPAPGRHVKGRARDLGDKALKKRQAFVFIPGPTDTIFRPLGMILIGLRSGILSAATTFRQA